MKPASRAGIELIRQHVKKYAIKSKTVSPQAGIELTVEVRLKDAATSFVNGLSQVAGVGNVALVSYNGEYIG